MKDIQVIREQFPILKNKIKLSSCSQSALHKNVKESINNYMESWETKGMDWEGWMAECEKGREKFAELINAEPEEIAIVSSVSHAISSVLTSIEFENGKNEIVLSQNDFPCIGHATLSQLRFNPRFVENDVASYSKAVSNSTKIVSTPLVSYYNGAKLNVEKIAEIAHEHDSYVFVDAYQAAGQIDIDVKKLNVDFLAAGLQKYLLGMPGIAFLYIKKKIANHLTPKITGWFGQADPFAFDAQKVEYAEGARRFDSGTFSMIHGYAANSALNILLDIGVTNIEKYLRELSQFTLDYCETNGLEVLSPKNVVDKGSNTAIKVPNASQVEQLLAKKNILVSARNDVIRIAPHFYNTKEEIKITVDELKKIIA